MPALTPILRDLITVSSLPLKALETDFAVDATGFGTSGTVTWYSKTYGHAVDNSDWTKLHCMTGVTTNIVTSVEVSGRDDHDYPFLPALVDATARNFRLREVSGDKAYSGVKNLEAIAAHGATPYIPFKSNTTGRGSPELWRRMWGYYQFERERFLEHYHKRSNAESTIGMIKAKFGGRLWSKSPIGQINEALCKVLCHNVCVVIQSMYELGIEATFWVVGRTLTTTSGGTLAATYRCGINRRRAVRGAPSHKCIGSRRVSPRIGFCLILPGTPSEEQAPPEPGGALLCPAGVGPQETRQPECTRGFRIGSSQGRLSNGPSRETSKGGPVLWHGLEGFWPFGGPPAC